MKHRLRHPVNAIREPFGKAGLVVAVLALVFAMVGGAWAAGGLSGKQKKEVTKIAKKFAGKPGPAGANGAPGATGPAGAPGTNGKDGTNGTNGKSVAVTEIPSGETECGGQGGALVKQEGAGSGTEVCNGTTGFTETLPEGKTETGTYSVAYDFSGEAGQGKFSAPISFTIPLFAAPQVEVLEFPTTSANCPVSGFPIPAGHPGPPQAKPGFLCVYELPLENAETPYPLNLETLGNGAGKTGTIIEFESSAAGRASVSGSWAVTEE